MSTSTKTYVNPSEKYDRVCVLIDMDAFYTQVEEYQDLERLKGKPIAVVQYLENAGIIAVNYPAKALGVTRHMRENEAKAACPELICVKVPSKNGKADLTKYRDAGCEVAKVLQTFTPLLERASIDEAYLDITDLVAQKIQDLKTKKFQLKPSDFQNTFAVGYDNIGLFVQDVTSSIDNKTLDNIPEAERASYSSSKLRLLIGACIVNEIRQAVKDKTNYECSAGIAHNKILAKLCCAFNKPNKQTIVPIESIAGLFKDLAVSKVKSLGGKLGEEICQKLNVKTMGDLLPFSEQELQEKFQPRIGSWLYWMSRGIDLEKVTPKLMSKSIAVSKNFRGKNEITSVHTLKFWLKELSKEIVERLEKDENEYNRIAKHMIVVFHQGDPQNVKKVLSSSRTIPLNGANVNLMDSEQISELSFETIKRNTMKFLKQEGSAIMNHPIKLLGITVGKFEEKDNENGSKSMQELFQNHKKRKAEKLPNESESSTPKRRSVEVKKKSPESSNNSIESLKKFEMKSPKPIMKAAKNLIQTSTKKENLIFIKSIEFNGNNMLHGSKSLHHWIKNLSNQLVKEIEENSKKNSSSPRFIQVEIHHDENMKTFEKIELSNIENDVFNLNEILDSTKKLENCKGIHKIEISAQEFQERISWKFSLPDEAHETENSEECDNENEEIDNNSHDENVVQDEFLNETIPIELPSSPSYSPIHEPYETEDIFEQDEDVQNEPIPSTSKNMTSTYVENEKENEPKPSTSKDYTSSYVEYKAPNILLEMFDEKENCTECGKMISKYEMTEHLDWHLAFALSKEQREEYRQSQRPSITSSQQVKKSIKTKKPNLSALSGSIKKFTVKLNEENFEESFEKIKCPQCYKMISIQEVESHNDYHFALNLSKIEQSTTNSPKTLPKSTNKKDVKNSVIKFFNKT